jgi:uncharacterized protein (DUF2336 family)
MLRSLPLINELEAALTSGTNARRIEMLTRITELFVGGAARYSEEQTGIFDDVMVRLVSTIEAQARASLARRLAPITNAPSSLVHMLAFDDDIDIAQPVLQQSERLKEPALLANASTKSQQHLFAISQRRSLSEAVTDVLVERGDRDVVREVVKNIGARFSDAGFRVLVGRSTGDDDLATSIARRGDIPRPHLLVLLEKASSAARARFAAENPPASTDVGGVAAEAVGGIRDDARNWSPDFAVAQAAVERQNRIRRVGEAEIYQYARDRKFEETAIALSLLCDMPIEVVERALLDPGAEIVLILAKVASLSAKTTNAILLLRAADRRMSVKDLDQALARFNRLHPDTARRVLGFFRVRAKKPAAPIVPPAVAING